ncbi:MAG: energy transducer TonB [Proteobacteria bacterium]|nr:MAG: energy transducer TonB [Pseudomonadota bacterium]
MTPSISFGMTRTELIRWGTCFVAIFALHCAVAAAIIIKPSEGDVLDDIDAIEVDFTTASFENAPPRDVAPGEEQIQTEQAPPPAEQVVEKKEEQQEEQEVIPPTPAPEPEVALAPTPPKPEEKQEEQKEENPNTAPPLISSSVTTAPTATAARTASIVSWKRKLALHLQRNKRYPASAQARREHGTARVAFVVDRHGHVIESRLIKGTGSEALDQETLALLRRAEPLPTPPSDVPGTQFAFSVPFRFDLQ